MKRIVQKIKSYSKSIELSEGDKDDLRAQVVSFMQAHPIEEKKETYIKSPYAIFLNTLKRPTAVAVVLALIIGTSVTSAAENTLPGDLLYPVKIYINENIYDAFAFTIAEASWDTTRTERRFEEIEQLIARDKMNEENIIIAQEYLDKALEKAAKTSNPVEFGSIIDSHAAILAKIDRNHFLEKDVKPSIESTRKIVTQKKIDKKVYVEVADNNTVLAIPTITAANQKMIIAKERMDLVNEVLTKLKLDKDTQKRVDGKVNAAVTAYANGAAALEIGNYTLARDQFLESMVQMQEAKIIASVPKFLGFEDTEHSSSSTSTSKFLNESDINNIDSDKGKESEIEENDIEKEEKDDQIKETQEKVKELQDDIQDKVNDLLP